METHQPPAWQPRTWTLLDVLATLASARGSVEQWRVWCGVHDGHDDGRKVSSSSSSSTSSITAVIEDEDKCTAVGDGCCCTCCACMRVD
jgi:hypothetical protein